MIGFHGYSWLGMIVGWVFMAAVLVGLVFLIIWAVRRTGSNSTQGSNLQAPSAKEIAQIRYARGEINREEYQQILSDLKELLK